jgi:C4-dicarboxylate-specific signal transduction histidine kinase
MKLPGWILTPSGPDELSAERVVIQIRWTGLVLGFLLANTTLAPGQSALTLNMLLAVGFAYTALDTWFYRKKSIFLGEYPLFISMMESLFIGLLAHFHDGPASPFRYYYLLSLLCCILRHGPELVWITCALHLASWFSLCLVHDARLGGESRLLMPVVLVWSSWAGTGLVSWKRRTRLELERLNAQLLDSQRELESRIGLRTNELKEAQALMVQQEKMANFGLLAAGIAHEVGNPLTGVTTLVQMLQRRGQDDYTLEKLNLMAAELTRMRDILRELTAFSRPGSRQRTWEDPRDLLHEALGIAKYHTRSGSRIRLPEALEASSKVYCVRGQMTQVFLNLMLNALDAAGPQGQVELTLHCSDSEVRIGVRDNGPGVAPELLPGLFQPFVTSKKEGTGLGLFLSRKVVQAHGGTLEHVAVAESVGGAIFEVAIPLGRRPLPEGI